jgi:hypothetical protein
LRTMHACARRWVKYDDEEVSGVPLETVVHSNPCAFPPTPHQLHPRPQAYSVRPRGRDAGALAAWQRTCVRLIA